jgi:hypothetical protein
MPQTRHPIGFPSRGGGPPGAFGTKLRRDGHHDFRDIFRGLPEDVQNILVGAAHEVATWHNEEAEAGMKAATGVIVIEIETDARIKH